MAGRDAAMLDIGALKAMYGYAPVFTASRTNAAIAPHLEYLAKSALDDGAAIIFSGLDPNAAVFNPRMFSHHLCYLDSHLSGGLDSSDLVILRDDNPAAACSGNADDLLPDLQYVQKLWEDQSEAYTLAIMSLVNELADCVDGNTCHSQDVEDAMTAFLQDL